jgi:hypothetical protein
MHVDNKGESVGAESQYNSGSRHITLIYAPCIQWFNDANTVLYKIKLFFWHYSRRFIDEPAAFSNSVSSPILVMHPTTSINELHD